MATTAINEERFNTLYAHYRVSIKKVIQHTLKYSQEMCEEMEQETWLKVWRVLPRTEIVSYAWLSTIATRTVYDALRHKWRAGSNRPGKERTASSIPLDRFDDVTGMTIGEALESPAYDIDTLLDAGIALHKALAHMTDDHRMICRCYLSGWSYNDIIARYHFTFGKVNYAVRYLYETTRRVDAGEVL